MPNFTLLVRFSKVKTLILIVQVIFGVVRSTDRIFDATIWDCTCMLGRYGATVTKSKMAAKFINFRLNRNRSDFSLDE